MMQPELASNLQEFSCLSLLSAGIASRHWALHHAYTYGNVTWCLINIHGYYAPINNTTKIKIYICAYFTNSWDNNSLGWMQFSGTRHALHKRTISGQSSHAAWWADLSMHSHPGQGFGDIWMSPSLALDSCSQPPAPAAPCDPQWCPCSGPCAADQGLGVLATLELEHASEVQHQGRSKTPGYRGKLT